MNKLFVTFELAKQLKETGFDEKSIAYYFTDKNNNTTLSGLDVDYENHNQFKNYTSAPLWQQVVDWLDSKNIYITIDIWHRDTGKMYFGFTIGNFENHLCHESWECKTRIEALTKAIQHSLLLLKDV